MPSKQDAAVFDKNAGDGLGPAGLFDAYYAVGIKGDGHIVQKVAGNPYLTAFFYV